MNTEQQLKYGLRMAIAGLVSGVLTLFVTKLPGDDLSIFFLGGVFGVVISAYLALTGASLRIWSAIRFTIVCCCAYFFAFLVTSWVQLLLPLAGLTMSQDPTNSPVAFFVGGSLGSFLVLSEALFLLHPESPWSASLLSGLRWSPVGGILGAIGCMLGSGHPEGFNPLLFIVWQTGVGGLIGFVASRQGIVVHKSPALPRAPKKTASPLARSLPIAYTIFFVSIVGVFSYYVIRDISGEHAVAVQQRRIAAAMAAAPSAVNLPAIVPVPPDQALVVDDIDGNVPALPYGRPMNPASSTEPPTYDYSIGYQQSPMASRLDIHPVVQVFVTQYPNPEWATYRLKDIPIPNSRYFYGKDIQKVTKFTNLIYENTGWRHSNGTGDLYYYWASNQYLVMVKFTGATVDDQFLQRHLKKYPSSP